MRLLAAGCPAAGGPSNVVNIHNAGGSAEASALMALVSTPAAIVTFPYIFHAFCNLLVDQGGPSLCNAACRARLLADLPPAVLDSIAQHAVWALGLPMAAGIAMQVRLGAGEGRGRRAGGGCGGCLHAPAVHTGLNFTVVRPPAPVGGLAVGCRS